MLGAGHNRKRLFAIALCITTVVIAGAAVMYIKHTHRPVTPKDLAARISFPIYVPKQLPGSFQLDAQSFRIEEDGILVFRIRDAAGASITFTEQARPAGMDFEKFYKEQFKDSRTLSRAQYASVTGKTLNGQTRLLSIVTDETWVIASTTTPIDEYGWEIIAQHLRKD